MAEIIIRSIDLVDGGKYRIIGAVTTKDGKGMVDVVTSSLESLKMAGIQVLNDLTSSSELKDLKAGDKIDLNLDI